MSRIRIGVLVAFCVALGAAMVLRAARPAAQEPASLANDPKLIEDLVYANRILYQQQVLDGFGHVSVRSDKNPDHFLMAHSMAPGLVTAKDIMEWDREGEAVDARGRNGYTERYIHAAIYRVRPDVRAIVHSHSPDVIPYSITGVTLRPTFHNPAFLRLGAPIFDSQKEFGDTDMLIRDNKIGDALAKVLGNAGVALIRGHGFVAVGPSAQVVVYRAIYTQVNARVQAEAMKLGTPRFLSPGEAEKAQAVTEGTSGRPWELWKAQVGKIE
ncbi:MAG TPA: class II aldolase/adducin family protein [Verrucomicrobiae bacterium]|jgi:ribulose-5-phosphate 4-epimerase/fuculose-1-phosphate aldolase|nr:class II aldolase/adducin family protein [Verrucomicrobiae bacterium]